MHSRREFLCKEFARKSFKNPKFQKWFKLNNRETKTRLKQPKLLNVVSRTNRFRNSPIREASEFKNVTKSGKSPKEGGGGGQHKKSKSPKFKIWTF